MIKMDMEDIEFTPVIEYVHEGRVILHIKNYNITPNLGEVVAIESNPYIVCDVWLYPMTDHVVVELENG